MEWRDPSNLIFFVGSKARSIGKGEDIHVARADRLGKPQGPGGGVSSAIRQGQGGGVPVERRRRL